MSHLYRLLPARRPLLINVPHAGTILPDHIARHMPDWARALPDTDWHVDRLFAFAAQMGVGLMVANYSRYVVDLNRDPAGRPLYPGRYNSELVPIHDFQGRPLYDVPPDEASRTDRVARFWRPYHIRLAAELMILHRRFPRVVLLDAHSVPALVPLLFEGRLPDLNLGTADGTSCAPEVARRIEAVLGTAELYSWTRDGRFKGGYITRHYGRPEQGIHAVQLEMVQDCYMEDGRHSAEKAAMLELVLQSLVQVLLDWAE